MLKAISKLDFKSIKLSAAALKATTLKANKKPQANPTKVDLDNRFLKITLRSLVEKIKTKEKILDLGSGGGFPGIILAILRPESEIHLLEKSQKKCYFLNKTKDALKLKNVSVLKTTISQKNTLEKYSVITARAFSSIKNILDLTKNNLKENGRYLLLKGRAEKIEEEITAINTNNYKYEIIELENKKYERHIVQITKNE